MQPLLTIAIPTFNRRPHLQRLLHALMEMTHPYADRLEILVSDNASDDGTAEMLAALPKRVVAVRTLRNPENMGPDANIAQCYTRASGSFVWILGDDDMPKRGTLASLLQVLESQEPDLVFLPSEWLSEVDGPEQGSKSTPGRYLTLEREGFARRVNVWLTFLSGIVIRKRPIDRASLDELANTNLIQLAWVLQALKLGSNFGVFAQPMVLATGGNTGGYAVVRVFGATLSSIVADQFGRGSSMYRAILGPTVSGYLPQLVWNIRTGTGGAFAAEFPWRELRRELNRFLSYRIFVEPVGRLPLPAARLALFAARGWAKMSRSFNQRQGVKASRMASSHSRP